jgi:hypothetical protein
VSATAFGIFRKFGPPPAARRLFARLPTPGAAASATAGPYKINDARCPSSIPRRQMHDVMCPGLSR